MCPGHLSHQDEERDKDIGDDDEDSDDRVTSRCDTEEGIRKERGKEEETK